MCCACSSGQKNLVCGDYCKVCHSSCRKLEIEKPTSALDQEIITRYCRPILEQHARECSVLESSSPSTPQHSIIPSQSTLTSSFSCSGVLAGDMISQIRENRNEAVSTSQEQLNDYTVRAEELLSIDSPKNTEKKSFHDNDRLDGTGKATSAGDSSGSVILERHEDGNDGKVGHLSNTLEDVRSILDGDESDGAENAIHSSNAASFLSTTETDPLIWKPPAPVDIEDDMDNVANYDDDEYSDGTKWGQSSCLSGFDVEHGSDGTSLKEERQKAMMEAMNGQFKILVNRFLASEDINFSEGGNGEKWLDIVATLSWEAALLIKPEANEGRAMDPGSYVKVKCVASGARSQSEVIKGLVFKKNTAHKHMPTKCKNPRLLLLQGVLGHREVGLSSFNAMREDDDYLKSIHETIKTCNPNMVLVEKSVSRDMQEFLLEQGITLVFDMKLTRLNRIARCVGSPIKSCVDILSGLKVMQCDMFHVEKFVEEHNGSSEGGKRSSKTLMFLEGFPKPLGCTILLKGAPIVELKKVKRVLQYTVFAAYHLILETSFFSDQRALFPDMHAEENDSLKDKITPANECGEAPVVDNSCTNCNPVDIAHESSSQAPSSNGSLENSVHEDMYSGSNFKSNGINGSLQSPRFSPDIASNENIHGDLVIDKLNSNTGIQPDSLALPDIPWQFMSSFSSSLKKFLSDSFTPVNSDSMSSYFGFEEELDSHSVGAFSVLPSLEAHDHEAEATSGFIQEKPHDEISDIEKVEPLSSLSKTIEHNTTDLNSKSEMENKDNIENVLDPQSILVLMSSQCLEKGIVCEHSHLSRIKYYGNFDVSLGRFIRDTLLSKKHRCSSCGEPPEAHVYCYTHQNGNLTVLVKELDSPLSGEQEGKIWMWTRCLKCEHENGSATSTERVVMSTEARGLSFGKFLELSFSSHSVASRLSSKCGHSLHRDCLRFFGLGSKVAMFRYSSVEIYAACKPPPVMDFNNHNGHDWIKREAKSVLRKGDLLFLEVANFLRKLKCGDFGQFQRQSENSPGSVKDLCEAEKMLIQEKSEFEASLLRAINLSWQLGKSVSEILSLSWLNQELLLELYIWDCRLHYLLQCIKDNDDSHEELQDQHIQDNALQGDKYVERTTENHEMDLEGSIENPTKTIETSSHILELDLRMESAEISENECNFEVADLHSAIENDLSGPVTEQASFVHDQEDRLSSSENMQVDHSTPANVEQYRPTDVLAESEVKTGNSCSGGENSAVSMSQEQLTTNSLYEDSSISKSKDPNEWIWSSAVELRKNYRMDLRGDSLQKFEYVLSYTPKYLSPIQLVSQERELLHFPLGADGGVISVCEDDVSSMIACALARSEHQHSLVENIDEKDALEGKGEAVKVFDNSWSLTSDGSVASSFCSSTGSAESEGIHPSRSLSSLSSDESSSSGSESSFFVDRSIASENLHPEISVGGRKASARNKYSVVLIHAKQFYSLRRICCPSELAYISSLSRSKRWDAQGGKSKAFFAKTLDDRFIIKQVKKTEIDSFLKFAPEYFRHITCSISSGSQTCLAKILGIYQVRQSRGGKDVKTDLMVMENLLFGHNFARTYDLKGAVFSRYVSDPNEPEKVLLDENFVEDMRISPMYIAGRNKHLFQRAIWNDTSFLTSINVMDYSLLVGVDKQRRELVFGIIDYLRQYTWDKQLETWVKSSLVVPKNSLPTVISPKEYKKRFRKFMSKYFLTVPDTWRSEQCSGPCKFCNDGNSSSAENCQNSQTAAISDT